MSQDKKAIADIIKQAGVLPLTKRIWRDYPDLEQVAISLADYIGLHPLDKSGEPLLKVALLSAVAAYGDAVLKKRSALAAVAFVSKLMEHAQEVFAQALTVETAAGTVQWQMLTETSSEFLLRYPDLPVLVTRRDPLVSGVMARALIATKIVPPAMIENGSDSSLLAEILGGAQELSH